MPSDLQETGEDLPRDVRQSGRGRNVPGTGRKAGTEHGFQRIGLPNLIRKEPCSNSCVPPYLMGAQFPPDLPIRPKRMPYKCMPV